MTNKTNSDMPLHIVILAAGKGKRMHSKLAKVLHPLAKKPLLLHVIETARQLNPEKIHVVYGCSGEQLLERFSGLDLNWAEQKEQLGTGHAVKQALPDIPDNSKVLILYGDVPLIGQKTLEELTNVINNQTLGVIITELDDPSGYGRMIRNADQQVIAIIEDKDANAEQKKIKQINSGIMAASGATWKKYLNQVTNNNAQQEYYLTDVLDMAANDEMRIYDIMATPEEVLGINNKSQLANMERIFQRRIAKNLLQNGVTLLDPERIDVRGDLTTGEDVSIDINNVFEGTVKLGDNVTIGANCYIKNATIADNVTINANSYIEECVIEATATVGPFARIRPTTLVKAGAKVGNFVEIKNSTVGEGSKVSHLTYIGDTTIGNNVNIGAGTITCNYDGANKYKTIIKDGAFIGSNSALIAPVTIGQDAYIATGSVINRDAPDGKLTIARKRQTTIERWKRPEKIKKG